MRSFPDGIWSRQLTPRGFPVDEGQQNLDAERLQFVMEPPEITDEELWFRLWMVNDTDTPATVYVSGFGLQPSHLPGLTYQGPPLQPPAPPLHVEATLPARSRVAFPRMFRLADWDFGGKPFDYPWQLLDHGSRIIASGVVKDLQGPPTPEVA